MPSIFKALATITVWVLFVFGFLRLLIGIGVAFMAGREAAPIVAYLDFAVGVGSITLSAVIMWIRQKLG